MPIGYRITRSEALKAFCCECTGNYGDGRNDCEHQHCEFYSKHRYRKLQPNYDWVFKPWAQHELKQMSLGMTKQEYLYHKYGNPIRISISHIFKAMCFRCNAYFQGGAKREDCGNVDCPIYYWMPYRQGIPTLNWMFDLDYSDKHNQRAIIEGYVIRGKTQIIIDRQRYIEDHFTWNGPRPKFILPPRRKVRKIA
jgi:hypothetical protein